MTTKSEKWKAEAFRYTYIQEVWRRTSGLHKSFSGEEKVNKR